MPIFGILKKLTLEPPVCIPIDDNPVVNGSKPAGKRPHTTDVLIDYIRQTNIF